MGSSRRTSIAVIAVVLAVLAGWAAWSLRDPWGAELAPPTTVEETAWYAISLRGKLLGHEQRLRGRDESGAVVVRRRLYRFVIGGRPTDVRAGSRDPDGPLPASHAVGPLRYERVQGPASFEPVDLVALLRVPTATIPNARSSHLGRYELDGESLRIELPLAAEIPPGPQVSAPSGPLADVARRVVGPDASRRDAVRAALTFVRHELEHSPRQEKDPLRTLAAGTGDCSEYTALFVAVVGAVGVPVREVDGIVYTDVSGEPGFVPHRWAEVDLGNGWTPTDPTFGQLVADATHIPLSTNGVEALVGGLDLRVVEVR